jgi:hypothetical protein
VKALRTLHLYLGCAFAPLLVFFALSGIWQRFGAHYSHGDSTGAVQKALSLLSTIHTGRGLKSGANLSSPVMNAMALAMAMSLILTIALGVILAFRFGHKKVALLCLLGGTLIPIIACILAATA